MLPLALTKSVMTGLTLFNFSVFIDGNEIQDMPTEPVTVKLPIDITFKSEITAIRESKIKLSFKAPDQKLPR